MPIPGSISLASRQLPLAACPCPGAPVVTCPRSERRSAYPGGSGFRPEFYGELFEGCLRTFNCEDVMKAYLANLPPKICMLLTLSAVVIAYPVVMIVLPAIIRAVVPETARSILNLL
jgi:hypothetical protein